MLARLIPTAIFRAHWKALSNYTTQPVKPDYGARLVVGLAPIAAGVWAYFGHATLRSPEAYLAALAIFAGGMLAAFTHLAGVRQRLEERKDEWGDADAIDRDAVDETSAHLLVAAYTSGLAAAVLVVGLNLSEQPPEGPTAINGWFAAIAITVMVHVLVVFLIAVPRLYSAYTSAFTVRDALNGQHRGRG